MPKENIVVSTTKQSEMNQCVEQIRLNDLPKLLGTVHTFQANIFLMSNIVN